MEKLLQNKQELILRKAISVRQNNGDKHPPTPMSANPLCNNQVT